MKRKKKYNIKKKHLMSNNLRRIKIDNLRKKILSVASII